MCWCLAAAPQGMVKQAQPVRLAVHGPVHLWGPQQPQPPAPTTEDGQCRLHVSLQALPA